MATFVLVHGSWHGGWCYDRVARQLRQGGHDVYTPTLTGMGERVHLSNENITLDTYVDDVVNVIEYEGLHDVILGGHSFGGVVITAVAGRIASRLRALVYIDAFVPGDGESYFDLLTPETTALILGLAKETGAVAPIPAAAFNVNERDAAWVDEMCVPQALAPFAQAVTKGVDSVGVNKKTYIDASHNGMTTFDVFYERYKDDSRWTVHTVACGHDVMLDEPEALVSILSAEA